MKRDALFSFLQNIFLQGDGGNVIQLANWEAKRSVRSLRVRWKMRWHRNTENAVSNKCYHQKSHSFVSLYLHLCTHTYTEEYKPICAACRQLCLASGVSELCYVSSKRVAYLIWTDFARNGRRTIRETKQALCLAWMWRVCPAGMSTLTQITEK